MELLRRNVIERLPRYANYVRELAAAQREVVSSAELARLLGIDDTLVRHDLALIGVRGQRNVGFRCRDILDAVRKILAFEREIPAVLVGYGRLGGAIVAYRGFDELGLRIRGIFDLHPDKIGQRVGRLTVRALDKAPGCVRAEHVQLGILTVPPDAAQEVADLLIDAGVRALWSFAPMHLRVPPHVIVRDELLSVGLSELSYKLARHGRGRA